jgi:glucokinase
MTGMAAEFGHMTVEPEGAPCGCGNRGCLEQYASATAVVRMAGEAIDRGDAPRLAAAARDNPEFSAQAVYELAIQGDEEAARIFRTTGRALGIVLASLVNALNLSMYLVAGGVASAWEAFAPSMFEELRCRSLVYTATTPAAQPHPAASTGTRVTRALLGSDAGLYGAARLPMIRPF